MTAHNLSKEINLTGNGQLHKALLKFLLLVIFIVTYPSITLSAGFNSVYSADGNFVIAVGNNGNIFRSYDGGSGFSYTPQGGADMNSVFCINSKVWIACDSGKILISTNYGYTFNSYYHGMQEHRSVFFYDENTGWLVGNNGTIAKTTDGGLTWTSQTSPVNSHLCSVRFITLSNGVACGDGGKVIQTTNGGSTWTEYQIPTTENLMSIDMKGNNIIATGEKGFIVKYNGSNWSVIDYKIETKSEVRAVSMINENVFYTCGGGGFIRKTFDGGATFAYQKNPMMGNLVSVHFYDSLKGWAVSSLNNAVLRTNDGGNSWALPAGTAVNYSWTLKQSGTGNIGHGFCLHPINKKTVFIAMGNKVYRSLNAGNNWTQISTITPGSRAHTFFVSSVDSNYWLASMDEASGRVVRTTDYGVTWATVWGPGALTSYGMPMMADQNTPNQVYLNPDNSALLRSTNWGLNWSQVGTKIFRSPDNITIAWENPDVIYSGDGVTGSGVAELFRTTNGGINWSLIHSVSGSEIPFTVVSSLDPKLSYHTCWSSGGIFKTTDMWESFTQAAGTSNAWSVDIAKDDPTAVGYGVYGSNVYISTNSGSNFVSTSVGSSPEAGMLFYDKGTVLSQKGGGVYKLNITYDVPTSTDPEAQYLPQSFVLMQNFPNPFNPSTTIEFYLPNSGLTTLKLFDINGREVRTLMNGYAHSGYNTVKFSGIELPSGSYFYQLRSGELSQTRKMILLK
jgi:photosystem II stability/assembly factor-like uncharacterized protein